MQVSTTTTFLNIEYQSGMQYLSNVKAFGTRKPPFFFLGMKVIIQKLIVHLLQKSALITADLM